jgi:hypothetical protein
MAAPFRVTKVRIEHCPVSKLTVTVWRRPFAPDPALREGLCVWPKAQTFLYYSQRA